MPRWSGAEHETKSKMQDGVFGRQLLLIPEAPVLLALLLIGWAYHFPPAVTMLAALTIVVFLLRLLLMTTASQYLDRGHYGQAERLSQAALRMYPWSADALLLRAQAFILRGEDAAAEELLRRALELAPDSPMIHSALAGVLIDRGRFAAAREHAARASRYTAAAPYAVQHLAWLALHVDGEPISALRILSTVDTDQLPPSLAAPLLVAVAETQLARGATQPVRTTLGRIEPLIEQCAVPQQAELCYQIGRLKSMVGGESGSHYRRSVAIDPDGRYAHVAWRAAMDAGDTPTTLAAS